jgi:hypothetical protein
MKKTLLFLIAISHFSTLLAQDSTRFYDKIKLDWESYNAYTSREDKSYLLPQSIYYQRQRRLLASDNPLYHGATSFGLQIQTEIIKNYKLDVRIMTEHRGISYGVFSTQAMIVYPIFMFNFVDTIKLGKLKWTISGIAGQHRDFQEGEGLYLYNLNCHAERFHLQVNKHIILKALHLGDLLNSIGLALDEVYQGSVIFSNIPFSKNGKKRLDVQFTMTQWQGYYDNYRNFQNPIERVNFPELVTTLHLNANAKIYAHVGFKPVNTPYQIDSAVFYKPNNVDKFAAVIGTKWTHKTDKLTMETVAEARFYGKAFNFERNQVGQFYRGQYNFYNNNNYNYNTTIGQNLYPILSFDRPFSQWAVFTEYRHKNVGGLTLRTKGNLHLKDRWYAYFDVDYNAIFAENERPFNYLFATLCLNYKLRKDIDCSLGLTNKGMNLDVFYPTFYFHKQPSLFIFLKKTLTP